MNKIKWFPALLPISLVFLVNNYGLVALAAEKKITVAVAGPMIEFFDKNKASIISKLGLEVEIAKNKGLGSDTILLMVDRKETDVGITSTPWDSILAVLKQKNVPLQNSNKLKRTDIADSFLKFYTYKGGPKKLSNEQITKILSGEVINWKDVGGEDANIQLVVRVNTNGTQQLIKELFLNGQNIYQKGLKTFNEYKQVADYVSETRGAYCFGGTTLPDFQKLNSPSHSKIVRKLYMISLGDPSEEALKLVPFIKSEMK